MAAIENHCLYYREVFLPLSICPLFEVFSLIFWVNNLLDLKIKARGGDYSQPSLPQLFPKDQLSPQEARIRLPRLAH